VATADLTEVDVREGGRWTRLQRLKNDVLFALATGALATLGRLPASVLRALGRGLGLATWALAPELRRLAEHNVARGLPSVPPDARRAFVRRVYQRLGILLGDTVAALDPRRPLQTLPLLPNSRTCLEQALAEGRGVVFASAHLGPWEQVAASLVAAGFPLTVVAREPYDPRLSRIYDRLREGRGVRAVYRGRPGAAARILRVLRRGGILGIPMDLRTRATSMTVPFLDIPSPSPIGPARLALRTGAAVVVGTVTPLGKGPDDLGISFVRVEPPADGDFGNAEQNERELTSRVNAELSRRIRALPEAWPWMHDRFRTSPP
jgi:KDO2-lipid IV(A) lauroyltransferase